MPTPIEQEALDHRREAALLRSMETALSRLGVVEQQAVRAAVESDLKRDNTVPARLTAWPLKALEVIAGPGAGTL